MRDRPTAEEIVERDDGAHRLAAYLLQRYATGVSTSIRNGICTVRLHFDQ